MKKDEELHIETIGDEKFDAALAKATIEVRQDRRLVGLEKIRQPLAFEAALLATGFPRRGFSLGKGQTMTVEIMEICEEVLKKATDAAKVPA
jgi:hypothetical protein